MLTMTPDWLRSLMLTLLHSERKKQTINNLTNENIAIMMEFLSDFSTLSNDPCVTTLDFGKFVSFSFRFLFIILEQDLILTLNRIVVIINSNNNNNIYTFVYNHYIQNDDELGFGIVFDYRVLSVEFWKWFKWERENYDYLNLITFALRVWDEILCIYKERFDLEESIYFWWNCFSWFHWSSIS